MSLVNLTHVNRLRSIPLVIFATSFTIFCMWLFMQVLPAEIFDNIVLDAVFIVGLFILSSSLFNLVVWRWRVLRWLGLIQFPDLNGQWTGYLTSEWTEHSQLYPISIEIKQTWLTTQIDFRASDSASRSHSVAILRDSDGNFQVHYIYHARPSRDVHPDWEPFYGLCIMTYRDGKILSGYYEYFNRQSQSAMHGQLYVERGTTPIKTIQENPRQLG